MDEYDNGMDRRRSIDSQRRVSISAIDKAVELTNESRRNAAGILKVLISMHQYPIPIILFDTLTHLTPT